MGQPPPGDYSLIMASKGRLRPKGVPFSGFMQVYEMVGILLLEVYESVAKSVISVGKQDQKG